MTTSVYGFTEKYFKKTNVDLMNEANDKWIEAINNADDLHCYGCDGLNIACKLPVGTVVEEKLDWNKDETTRISVKIGNNLWVNARWKEYCKLYNHLTTKNEMELWTCDDDCMDDVGDICDDIMFSVNTADCYDYIKTHYSQKAVRVLKDITPYLP